MKKRLGRNLGEIVVPPPRVSRRLLASRVTSQKLTLREHNCRLKLDKSTVNEEQTFGFSVGFQK